MVEKVDGLDLDELQRLTGVPLTVERSRRLSLDRPETAMTQAFICDAIRTPFGRYGGALSSVRTDDLGADPAQGADGAQPDGRLGSGRRRDLRLRQPGRRGQPQRRAHGVAARRAARSSVPGATVNRLCGSGMDAVGTAARAIKSGEARADDRRRRREHEPRAVRDAEGRDGLLARNAEVYDTTIGWRFVNPLMKAQYGIDSMPETAENVAADYGIERETRTHSRCASQRSAVAAQQSGRLRTRRSCR